MSHCPPCASAPSVSVVRCRRWIAHAPVCVHDNVAEVYAAWREQIMNPRLPFYQNMSSRVPGFPEAKNGTERRDD